MSTDKIEGFLIGLVTGILVMGIMALIVTNGNYKDGQIDALTGKIKYELKKQEDGQTIWVHKDD